MALNKSLKAELEFEAGKTRKMLERITDDKLDWRPHAKSMTLGRLATHIAEIPIWIDRINIAPEFNFASLPPTYASAGNAAELINIFEDTLIIAKTSLDNASDELLNGTWTVKRGEATLYEMPRKVAIRNFAMNHLYHHRGQLSTYLRLVDIPVPGMYGPSADEH